MSTPFAPSQECAAVGARPCLRRYGYPECHSNRQMQRETRANSQEKLRTQCLSRPNLPLCCCCRSKTCRAKIARRHPKRGERAEEVAARFAIQFVLVATQSEPPTYRPRWHRGMDKS